MSGEELREAVRQRYAASAVAIQGAGRCCGDAALVGGSDPVTRNLYGDDARQTSADALAASLGCGNPTMLATLEPGDTVLDLGSGGGLDVLLSARRVGPTGRAYGVDMTDEMLDLARRNQRESGIRNAEFLKGTIEELPLPDNSVDVVISNCVINLAADKDAVLREAARVLRAGGRFAVSDIVLERPLPSSIERTVALWTGCLAGALVKEDYVRRLCAAGFIDVEVEVTRRYSRDDLFELAASITAPDRPDERETEWVVNELEGVITSAFVRATAQ